MAAVFEVAVVATLVAAVSVTAVGKLGRARGAVVVVCLCYRVLSAGAV